MTFSDVINDIKKLVGLELGSVRPGAEITIQEVDEEKDCLILRTAQGQDRSRPLSELRAIWAKMMTTPAVHVEGVLHGSGTSRNQPETILANLPYVEWLKVNNKKHIAYVGRNTHAYGTLKRMDSIRSAELISKLSVVSSKSATKMVSVTADVSKLVNQLQSKVPGTVTAVEPGIYSYQGPEIEIIILISGRTALAEGCYTVVETPVNSSLPQVDICDESYYVISAGNVKALVRA